MELPLKPFDFSIVRTLRMKWGLTAEELAARAGLTRATVVKMESGYGNPTIETIAALSRVFMLSASELIRMAEVAQVETGKQTVFQDGGFTGEHIGFSDFEIYHLTAGAGVEKTSDPGYHDYTAEVCLVLSGKVRIIVQGQTHELGSDMSIRFKALHEHRIVVLEDVEMLLMHHRLP